MCIATGDIGPPLDLHYASQWRVRLRGSGSWQYDLGMRDAAPVNWIPERHPYLPFYTKHSLYKDASPTVPSLKRAHPVLLSHLTSKEPTPGPSATKTSRHRDKAKPPAVLLFALIGSSAPKLAPRPPNSTKTAWNSTPDHPAFEPIDLGFKTNTACLNLKFGKLLLELKKEPNMPGCCPSREEYAIIEHSADMILSQLADPASSAYETRFLATNQGSWI